jgi:hypothetical protein
MSSSTKREISHDPREIEPKQRRSSRLSRKHLSSHCRKSSTSTEAKMPKTVKSPSSVEKAKLETLYSPNKGSLKRSLKVMKIVRTVTTKVNHHPKCPFGVHQTYPQELKSYLMQ